MEMGSYAVQVSSPAISYPTIIWLVVGNKFKIKRIMIIVEENNITDNIILRSIAKEETAQ